MVDPLRVSRSMFSSKPVSATVSWRYNQSGMGPSACMLGSAKSAFRWWFLWLFWNIWPSSVESCSTQGWEAERWDFGLHSWSMIQVPVSWLECLCTHLCQSGLWHLVYMCYFAKLSLRRKSLSKVHNNVLGSVIPSLGTKAQIQVLKALTCTVTTNSDSISWYISVNMVHEDWN